MRAVLQRIPSTYLAAFVLAADAALWLAALPFELYSRALVAHHLAGVWFLLFILVANTALLALMASSVAATGELIRRGFALPTRVPALVANSLRKTTRTDG
jgi:hypothetical protein